MAGLKLWLLGAPRLERDGVPLKVGRRKAMALLAYLALTGSAHRREALAALLWPDYGEVEAHAYLRQALWALKQALGQEQIEAEREAVSLVRNADFELDVDEFRRLLATCRTHGHLAQEVCPACLVSLGQAMALYRDDLLAGFTLPDTPDFDEWQFFQRESLRRELVEVLERLVRGYSARGELEPAIAHARRWLALDPLHEPAQRQLMQLYASAGQEAAALRQYQECVRILKEELGVPPAAETTALYEAIKAKRLPASPAGAVPAAEFPAAPGPQAGPAPVRPPPFLPSPSQPSSPPGPFVAREHELARLDEFLDSVLSGQGRVIFVTGEAGTGKTALAREFAWRAEKAHGDLIVASGNCNAYTGSGDPYLPFREVLSLLTGDVEAKWAAGMITPENANRLSAFMSVSVPALVELGLDLVDAFVPGAALASRAAALAPSGAGWLKRLEESVAHHREHAVSPPLEQSQISQQYTQVLHALAAQRPLLLILDDLHWADASSINLLFHLGRSIEKSRILIVGCYRPEDVAHGWDDKPHPLQGVLSEFKRYFGEIGVDLDHEAGDEGRRFVDALLDMEPNRLSETFRQTMFRHTAGHALFTAELLRDMRERGDLQMDEAGRWVEGAALDWETLPTRVEGMIEARIGRLPPELRQALQVASVEGEEFTAEVVACVQRGEEQDLVRRLSAEVSRRHRLVDTPSLQWLGAQHLSRYRFRHNLFQKYLYQTLDEAERAYLHAEVGRALETLYGDQTDLIAVQLARHYQAAGDGDKAVAYLLEAGQKAFQLSANEEAIGHFKQGVALLKSLPDSPERARQELALQIPLGNALTAIEGYAAPEVGEAYSRARQLCRALGDTPELFSVLSGLQRFYQNRGEAQVAREMGEQLVVLAQNGAEPDHLANAHMALGGILWFTGEFTAAQAHFEKGIAHYQRPCHSSYVLLYGDDPGVSCLSYAAWAAWFLGYPDQASGKSHAALALAEELSHPYSLAHALSLAAVFHQFRREAPAVQARAEAALALSTEHGFSYWMSVATILKGWAMVEQGQPKAGLATMRQGEAAWRGLGIEVGRHYLLALLAEAYGQAGQAAEGLAVLVELLPVTSGVGRWWEAELYRLKGELLPVEAEAEEWLGRALQVARQQGARSLELRAALSLARLWQRNGKVAEARQMLAGIYAWFAEGFDTADLQAARALLEELS
jgi:DNA-binding SARP family transcriptional activator